jgi:hypothetical protein
MYVRKVDSVFGRFQIILCVVVLMVTLTNLLVYAYRDDHSPASISNTIPIKFVYMKDQIGYKEWADYSMTDTDDIL